MKRMIKPVHITTKENAMTLALSSSSRSSRLESLRAKHLAVDTEIDTLSRHPSVSDQELRRLKRVKLGLKEQIEHIS